MKVLFTIPLLSYIVELPILALDQGLAYLAAAVKKRGHTAYLLDWSMPPGPNQYIAFLKKNKPDLVAMKVFTKDVLAANKTIELIKSVDNRIKVIVGGPHPSVVPAEELMEDFTGIDFAFRGEADEGLPQLLDQMVTSESPTDMSSVPGMVWRDEKGHIRDNPKTFTKDIDNISLLPYDIIDPAKYPFSKKPGRKRKGSLIPFLTSRGCPWNCTFCCVEFINGRSVRFRSLGNMQSEISLLYNKYKIQHLMITDNGFGTNIQFVEDFCRMLIREKFDVSWDCVLVSVEDFLDSALAKLMKQAGCENIHIGIETGSPRIREIIRKAGTVEQIRQFVSIFQQQGINISGYFMFGLPTETRDDIQKSIDLGLALSLKVISFDICFPLPGTEVYRYVKQKYGLTSIDWKKFDVYNSPYSAAEIPTSQLVELVRKANSHFLLRRNPLAFGKMLLKQYLQSR